MHKPNVPDDTELKISNGRARTYMLSFLYLYQ